MTPTPRPANTNPARPVGRTSKDASGRLRQITDRRLRPKPEALGPVLLPSLPPQRRSFPKAGLVVTAVLTLVAASACGTSDATIYTTTEGGGADETTIGTETTVGGETTDGTEAAVGKETTTDTETTNSETANREEAPDDDTPTTSDEIPTSGAASNTSPTDDEIDHDQAQNKEDESAAIDTRKDDFEVLADYLGPAFEIEHEPETTRALRLEHQHLIAECMAAEGFVYIPVLSPAELSSLWAEEHARETGFGITTSYGQDSFLFGDDWINPNQEIMDSMSDSELEAYRAALNGSSPDTYIAPDDWPEPSQELIDSMSESELEAYLAELASFSQDPGTDIEPEGCADEAFAQVWGSEIRDALNFDSMFERFLSDPRVLAANGEWSDCMSDKGYDYTDREQLINEVHGDFSQRLLAIVGTEDLLPYDFVGLSDFEMHKIMSEISFDVLKDMILEVYRDRVLAVDQEAVAALQQEERDLAVATVQCEGLTYAKTIDVRREYEHQLVSENRALLEEYRAKRLGTQ